MRPDAAENEIAVPPLPVGKTAHSGFRYGFHSVLALTYFVAHILPKNLYVARGIYSSNNGSGPL
jgi:hypothetical protein